MTTNLIADRMRVAMRIDMPEQHKALQAGVEEIERLWKFCMTAYRWLGRPFVGDARSLPGTFKAQAYDALAEALYENVPAPAESGRTIADIRASDAQSAATWFTGKPNATAVAMRDRRWLLAEVQRLEAELAAARQTRDDAAARAAHRERLLALRRRAEIEITEGLDAVGKEAGVKRGRGVYSVEPDSDYRGRILHVLRLGEAVTREPA